MSENEKQHPSDDEKAHEDAEIKNGINAETGDEEKNPVDQNQDLSSVDEEQYLGLTEDELRNILREKDELIQKLNDELNVQKDTALRKVAELENVKKRSQRERTSFAEEAKVEALEKILPLREDLQRSLKAAESLDIDRNFLDGVKMVADKFEAILDEYGVEPIEEEMVPFDVDIHDAMLRQPAEDENVESDTVLKVIETGYKVGNKVIKHAKVIVSQ